MDIHWHQTICCGLKSPFSILKSTQLWALNHELFGSLGILGLLDVDGFVDSACRPSSIATAALLSKKSLHCDGCQVLICRHDMTALVQEAMPLRWRLFWLSCYKKHLRVMVVWIKNWVTPNPWVPSLTSTYLDGKRVVSNGDSYNRYVETLSAFIKVIHPTGRSLRPAKRTSRFLSRRASWSRSQKASWKKFRQQSNR